MIPYEGKEPYIFVSYAHKDSETVLPLIEAMSKRGFRLWYDSGVEVGTEWPQFIAVHLQGCYTVLMLASKSFDESVNCRNELAFALAQKKSVVVLHLEDAALSFGTQLQISSFQQVYYSRFESVETLICELCRARILEACMEEPASDAEDFEIENGVLLSYFGDDYRVVIPKGVTSIGDQAFCMCDEIEHIVIPDSVTSIGDDAFAHCESLESAIIPQSVRSIGNNAFWGCDHLKRIVLPDSLILIGNHAFSECKNLKSITFPGFIENIGYGVFCRCNKLEHINLCDTNAQYYIENDCLIEKQTLTLLGICKYSAIPEDIKIIGRSVFHCCNWLYSISIPDGVTSIENGAFSYCRTLQSIHLPDSITQIGDFAFSNCSDLKSITLPNNVLSIGRYAFAECNKLQTVHCPVNLSIPEGCFPKHTKIIRR